jgi:DNA-binding transcriptional ArsR family regulator
MTRAANPYGAIADATRRGILDLLRHGSQNAGAIARRFRHISRPAVSKHLAILRRSRLVVASKRGRELRYSLNTGPLAEVDEWLRQYSAFWDQGFPILQAGSGSNDGSQADGYEH